MVEASVRNEYLEQVVRQKRDVEHALKARKCASSPAPMMVNGGDADEFEDEERPVPPLAREGTAGPNSVPGIRITGWWRWKRVVVPPNLHVVHTRLGHKEPLHCGLGVSFGFDPARDAYLTVPAAMQTIILNANCICRERQGVLVQGYVQWIIGDFRTAYRKLDFSDPEDPMRVVNVQLREQAEAAIKDVVATMGIDDVLADKQPIIKELTARLRSLAEGDGRDSGLGLKIVTVQIKEAVVSSPRVWEMLQRPFRAERSREARLAELGSLEVVRRREAEAEKAAAARKIETQAEVSRRQAEAGAAAFDREQAERVRRAKAEAETLAQSAAHEREKMERDAELKRLRVEQELIQQGMRQEADQRWTRGKIELESLRRKIDNDLSPEALQLRLVQALPEIAAKLPKPQELKSFTVGGGDALSSLAGGLFRLLDGLTAREGEKTR